MKLSIADKINLIDDVVTNEVEWSDYPTDDLQNAWVDIKDIVNQFYKEVDNEE
jgi:hypothetical protein